MSESQPVELIVYGDFNCPFSALASARVSRLERIGAVRVDWRAVEHAPNLPPAGIEVAGELASELQRELEQIRGLLSHSPLSSVLTDVSVTGDTSRMPTRTSTAPDVQVASKLFNGFADRTRLAILLELADGERRVTDLVHALHGSQGNVSGHLACLKDCGLVVDRPEGRQVFYRIAHPEVYDVLRSAEALLAVTGQAIELCANFGRKS